MRRINYILGFLIMFTFTKSIYSQSDFDLKLTETEINNTLDALIAARGLNFGDYYGGGTGLSSWIGDVKSAHVDIHPNNQIDLYIDDMYFLADINNVAFDFTIAEHISGILNGEIVVTGDEIQGLNAVIRITSIDNLSSWGDLGNLIGVYESLFGDEIILDYIGDIPLSLTNLTPDFVTDAFDFDEPLISTDNESMYLNFVLKGDRFVTIENQLNKINGLPRYDLGEIGHLEGTNFVDYQSGFEFAWDQNSSHTFRSDYDGEDLENYHYKYFRWEDQEINFVRTKLIDADYKFIAFLENSYRVNFGMTIEGISGNLGYFTIGTIDYNYPRNEYVVASPLSEPIKANGFFYNNNQYVFVDWENGLTNPIKNVSGTSVSQSYTANYKGAQLSNYNNAYTNTSQRKFR